MIWGWGLSRPPSGGPWLFGALRVPKGHAMGFSSNTGKAARMAIFPVFEELRWEE